MGPLRHTSAHLWAHSVSVHLRFTSTHFGDIPRALCRPAAARCNDATSDAMMARSSHLNKPPVVVRTTPKDTRFRRGLPRISETRTKNLKRSGSHQREARRDSFADAGSLPPGVACLWRVVLARVPAIGIVSTTEQRQSHDEHRGQCDTRAVGSCCREGGCSIHRQRHRVERHRQARVGYLVRHGSLQRRARPLQSRLILFFRRRSVACSLGCCWW